MNMLGMRLIKSKRGFTLIELMVVMVLMSVIAVGTAPKMQQYYDSKLVSKVSEDIKQLMIAAREYRRVNNAWPATAAVLSGASYIPASAANSPFGNGYTFAVVGNNLRVSVDANTAKFATLIKGEDLPNTSVAGTVVTSETTPPGDEAAHSALYALDGSRSLTAALAGGNQNIDSVANVNANRLVDRNDTAKIIDPSGTSTVSRMDATSQMRAPIYYDNNNTAYYVDPSSTSKMNYVDANRFRDRNNTAFYLDPASTSILNDIRPSIIYDRDNTGYYLNPNSTSNMYRVDAANQMRAPIFYDSNNTAYYLNPASRSQLNTLDVASIRDRNSIGYTWDGSGTSRMNYADLNYARLRNDYTEGASCTTETVGTTSTGELMSCVSSVWKKPGGGGIVASNYGASSGYVKFDDGFMMQWGRDGTTASTREYIGFQQAFTQRPSITTTAEFNNPWDRNASIYSITNNGFYVLGNGSLPFHWQAVGPWK